MVLETIGQPQRDMGSPALSPDGQRIAVSSSESGNPDIWAYDQIRSNKNRLTFDERREGGPTWSPSGREIAYWLLGGARTISIMNKAADGTGEAVVLVEAEHRLSDPDWSRDGRYLAYAENSSPETRSDIR
jgi:TolB protein